MSEQTLYLDHLSTLQARLAGALARFQQQSAEHASVEGLAIFAGIPKRHFLDDHDHPFQVNPQFKAWLPLTDNPWCLLLVNGAHCETAKPKLLYYRPEDYWHAVAGDPAELFWAPGFEIQCFGSQDELLELLPENKQQWAFVGEEREWAAQVGLGTQDVSSITHELDYYRAYKSEYELHCMREANKLAVTGHKAAREAFLAGQSELGIHLAYQAAVGQTENQLPYGNIVALNQNGAILHYTKLQTRAPEPSRSFLLDAGAEYNGYAADLTRTHAADGAVHDGFRELINLMNQLELDVISEIQPGETDYVELHDLCHRKLADVLVKAELVTCRAEQAYQAGITRTFLPHGLGHLLGLQVHDVAGFAQDIAGTRRPAPEHYPALRLTRKLEAGMVLTIEPGLYFIDSLLEKLKASEAGEWVNWQKVSEFKPYGGIRIEDNIVIHANSVENITRDLGLA